MGSNVHLNGGIEQGLLEAAEQDGVLSPADQERLNYLRSLPKDRAEIDGKVVASVPELKYGTYNPVLQQIREAEINRLGLFK